MIPTNHVVGEIWTFLRRRAGHREASAFHQAVSASRRVRIDHVAPEVKGEAWRCEAPAFDGDFVAAGFTEVR